MSEKLPHPSAESTHDKLPTQEIVPKETLKDLGKEFLQSYQEKPFEAVKQLSNLKRVGISFKTKSAEGKQKLKGVHEHLRGKIEDFTDDPGKLATYLKHLKHVGAISDEDPKYADYVNTVKKAFDDPSSYDQSKLSQLCIDAHYIGAKTNFADVKDLLVKDLENVKGKPNNESTIALRMVRLKLLSLDYIGDNEASKESIKSELETAGVHKKMDELESTGKWPQLVPLKISVNYLEEPTPLKEESKEKAREALNDLEKEAKATNNWQPFTVYAGHLGTLEKQERAIQENNEDADWSEIEAERFHDWEIADKLFLEGLEEDKARKQPPAPTNQNEDRTLNSLEEDTQQRIIDENQKAYQRAKEEHDHLREKHEERKTPEEWAKEEQQLKERYDAKARKALQELGDEFETNTDNVILPWSHPDSITINVDPPHPIGVDVIMDTPPPNTKGLNRETSASKKNKSGK